MKTYLITSNRLRQISRTNSQVWPRAHLQRQISFKDALNRMKVSTTRTRIVMAGGGFAALYAAKKFYLAKLPQLAKKLRVVTEWKLDLFLEREIEQTITARDIEVTEEKIRRVRTRSSFQSSTLQSKASVTSPTHTYAIR